MKLHLPKLLRNAVLACITAVAGIATTTVGTATFAGGVVAFAISQQQALAEGEGFSGPAGVTYSDGGTITASPTVEADTSYTLTTNDVAISAERYDIKLIGQDGEVRLGTITADTLWISQGRYSANSVNDLNGVGTVYINGDSALQIYTTSNGEAEYTSNFSIGTSTYDGDGWGSHPNLKNAALVVGNWQHKKATTTITGTMDVQEDARIVLQFGNKLVLQGGLTGDGDLDLSRQRAGDEENGSSVTISGSTTNYTGAIKFTGNDIDLLLGYETVNLGGLSGGTSSGTATNIVGLADGTSAATLNLNVAEGKSYTFSGTLGAGVNITMAGAGYQYIQSLEDDDEREISVTGGTLRLLGLNSAKSIVANGGQVILDYHMDVSRENSYTWGNNNTGQYYKATCAAPELSEIEIEGDVVINVEGIIDAQGVPTDTSSAVVTWFDPTGYTDDTMEVRGGLLSVFNPTTGAAADFGTVENIILNNAGIVSSCPWHHGATDPEINLTQNLEIVGTSYLRAGGSQAEISATNGSYITVLSGKITGSGNLQKIDGGTMEIAGDMSGFTGNLNVKNGQLRISGNANANNLDVQSGQLRISGNVNANALRFNSSAANLVIADGGSLTTTRAQLADTGTTDIRIEAGGVWNVTGSKTANQSDNTRYREQATFLLNHYSCDTNMEIAGTFNMLNNSRISLVDRDADKVVISVKDGGVMNVLGLVLSSRNDLQNRANMTLNVESGATLNVGSEGIAKFNVNGSNGGNTTHNGLVLNLSENSTLGILQGADSWSSERDIALPSSLNINTQGYAVSADGTTGTRENGSAGIITLSGILTGGTINKQGAGGLLLTNADNTVEALSIREGYVQYGGTNAVDIDVAEGAALQIAAAESMTGMNVANLTTSGDTRILTLRVTGLEAATADSSYQLFAANGVKPENVELITLGLAADLEAVYANGVLTFNTVTAATAGNLTWVIDGQDNEWNSVSSAKNWKKDDAAQRYVNGSSVTFGADAATIGESINVTGDITCNGVTIKGTGWVFDGTGSIGEWTAPSTPAETQVRNGGVLTVTQNSDITFAGDGNYLFNGIATLSGSTLSIVAQAKVHNQTVDGCTMPKLVLNDGTLSIIPRAAGKQFTITELVTSGTSYLETMRNSQSYDAVFNIKSLKGSGDLYLRSGSQLSAATLFNIEGNAADFEGNLHVIGNTATGAARRVTLNLKSASALSKAVVYFDDTNNQNNIGFGVGVDNATVAGLSGGVDGANSSLILFSGAGANNGNAVVSDGTVRTLVINTAENADYSTSATVAANLNLVKTGAGSQSFTGNLSAFNGTMTVSGGTLSVSSIGAATAMSITSAGATLAVADTAGVVLGSGKSLSAVNGAVLDAALTLSGGALTLGTSDTAWAAGSGLSLNNQVLTLDSTNKTALSMNLSSELKASGGEVVLFTDVMLDTQLAENATLGTYFKELAGSLANAALTYSGNKLLATINASAPLYWIKGQGTWSVGSELDKDGIEGGETQAFANGDKVTFGQLASDATVTISGTTAAPLTAGSVTVDAGTGKTYTFAAGSGEGVNGQLTTSTLTVTSGTAKFNNGALNISALETVTVNGTLDLAANAQSAFIKLAGITTGAGKVELNGHSGDAGDPGAKVDLTDSIALNTNYQIDGNMAIDSGKTAKTLTVNKELIFRTGDAGALHTLRLQNGTTLKIANGGSLVASAVHLGQGGTGGDDTLGHLVLETGGSIILDSFIKCTDQAAWKNTFTMTGGTLELKTANTKVQNIATTITGGTLQTGDINWGISGATIGGATIANTQVADTAAEGGKRAGTGVITLENATLTSGLTVTGKVQFKGAITLAEGFTPTATEGSHFVKADGTTSTSGYKVVDNVYSLSALGEDGAKLSTGTMTEFQDANTEAADTTWSVVISDTQTLTDGVFSATDKTVTFAGTRTAEYWVRPDDDTSTSVDVTYASTNTEFAAATKLVVDGGVLQLTTALGGALVGENGGGIVLNGTGTIELYDAATDDDTKVVLNASQVTKAQGATGTTYLSGNGVYDLGSVSSLGSNVADTLKVVLSDSWTGTVKLAGTIGGLDLDELASASSVVELAGVSGCLPQGDTISSALHLSGNGFTLNDSSTGTYTMSGAISGTGNLTIEIPNTNTNIALTGNLEKWSGGVKLVQHTTSENTPNLTLSLTGGGNMFAQTNNGIEMDRGGVMNVTIGNTTTATTMRGTITNKGAGTLNLTIQGDTDLDAAVSNTGTGTLNLTNNGTLDVDAATTVSSLTNAGTLNLNAATTVSSLTNNAEKTATVAAGTTLKAVTVNNAGTMTVNGTLAVDDAVASNVLAVTNSGTLSLANDTTLGTLSNSGTLTATGKTLTVTGGITGVTTGTGESATTAYGSIEAGALTLQAASNTVSTLTLTGALTLGTADAASALTVNGAMSVAEVQVNNLGNAISAASLTSTALNISITEALLTNLLGTQDKTMTLLTLTGENATLDTSILSVNNYAYGNLGSSENGQFTYELCVSADGKALTLVTALAGAEWNEATGTRWNAAGLQDADFIHAAGAASGFAEAVTKDTSVVIELSNEAMPQDFIVVNGAVEANNLTVDRWGVEHGDFTISAGEDTLNAVADSITVYQDMFVNGNRNLIIGDAVAADGAEGLALNVHHNLTINESAGLIVAANAALTVGVADDPETEVDETAAGKLTVNGKFSNVGDVDVNGDVTIAENAYLYSGVMALTGAPFGDTPSSIDITGKVTNKGNLINYALGNVTIGAEGTPADTTSLVNTGSVVVNGGTVTINGSMDNAEAGSLTVGSAEMAVTGALDNTSGGSISIAEGSSLSVGTTSATADLTNGGGTLDITGGTLAVSGALNNTATVDGQTTGGSITIDENATVTVGGALNNTSGSINIDGGSSLTVGTETTPADLTNSGGSLDVIGGTLAVTGNLDNTNGSITIGTAGVADDPVTEVDETKAATTGSLTVGGDLVNYGGGNLTVQGEGSTVEVTGDLALSELTTDASGNEVVATTGSLTVGEGTELTVGGNLVANEMELAFGGNVTVGEKATIGELTNDGTLTAKNADIGTLHNNGGLFVQAELLPGKDSEGNDQYDGGNLTIGLLDGSGDVTVSEGGTLSIANSADFTGKLTNYGKIVMTPVEDDEGNETTPSFTISESTEQGGNIEAPVLVIGGQMKDVVDEAGNVVIDPDTQEAVKEYESASGTVLGEVVTDEIRFDNMELVVQDHPTDSTQKIEAPILTMTSIASTAEGTDAEGNPIQKDIALHFTQLESAEGVTSLVQDLSTWFEPDTEGNVRETVTITLLAVKEIAENVSGFVLAADYAEHEEFAEYYQQLLSAGYKLSNLKDPLNPEVVTFALRNTPEYQEVTIDVQKQTVDDATWTVENDKLTTSAGLVIGTMTDGTVKLLKNSILDNVQSVVVKQNIAIDLTGNAPDELDDQGNLEKVVAVNIHGLMGDKNLTIRGENTDADVVNIDVASDGYNGQLVLNKVNATVQGSAANKPAEVKGGIRLITDTLADLNVKDTVVDATDGGVVLKGNMEKGSLKLDIGEKLAFQSGSKAPLAAASSLKLDGTGLDIAYNDKGATTMDMTGVSKTGQVLVNMSKMTGTAGDIVIGKDGVQSALLDKYFSGIRFDANKHAVVADRNTSYYTDLVSDVEVTSNGMAGMALADAALLNLNPQVEMQGGGLATMLDAIEKAAADGSTDELDHLGAALAGASSAVLGMAAHGDLDRQLQAIRNRTTTMGVDQSVVHPEIPYFNAWINAEGDYRELSDNGAEGGYKLSSWGGTVGFDVDCSPTVTAGLAFTAMYGDLTVTGADDAHGDFDTYYLSAFARYCASAWTHTFVATLGTTDFAMERTVMDSKQEYTTSGTSFGLMYELGRVYALDEDATSCIQPVFNITWRHTSVDGYQEDGNDLALEVDSQTLNTVTLGLGARVQAIVGENMYNRASIFECRLFAKADIGDRRSSTEVNLAGGTAEIESAEVGALGLEAGAGLTIPLGDGGSSLFMDASVELRADYTNVNGTVGYRVNF